MIIPIFVRKRHIFFPCKSLPLCIKYQTYETYDDEKRLYPVIRRIAFRLRISLHDPVLRPMQYSQMVVHSLHGRTACRMYRHLLWDKTEKTDRLLPFRSMERSNRHGHRIGKPLCSCFPIQIPGHMAARHSRYIRQSGRTGTIPLRPPSFPLGHSPATSSRQRQKSHIHDRYFTCDRNPTAHPFTYRHTVPCGVCPYGNK